MNTYFAWMEENRIVAEMERALEAELLDSDRPVTKIIEWQNQMERAIQIPAEFLGFKKT